LLGRALRIVYSLAISILPLLYLGGYLSFIPGLPAPTSLLSAFGVTNPTGFFDVTGGGANTLVPFGTMGLSGLIAFQLLSRVGNSVSSAAMMASMPSPNDMMRQMNFQNFPNFMAGMAGSQMGVPETLPADITKPQYLVLQGYRRGFKNPKEVSKSLSMDKDEVEKITSALVGNGYLTKGKKLTSKALEILT
jgi:hypothetical protein